MKAVNTPWDASAQILKLLCGNLQCVYCIHKALCSQRNIMVSYEKTLLIFLYHYSLACKLVYHWLGFCLTFTNCRLSYWLEFHQNTYCKFWLRVRAIFSTICRTILNTTLPFCTVYLCKTVFSGLMARKIKVLINSEQHWWCQCPVVLDIQARLKSSC